MHINLPHGRDYLHLIEKAFDDGRITNNGPLVTELEIRLAEYLGVPYVVLTSSGTLALQIAFKLFDLRGEVITTPFSWITTSSAMSWVGLNPKFVDVDRETFNLDPEKIKDALSERTSAIVPVHVFGNVCDVERIEEFADSHGLRVIYDAAHAFGVRYGQDSVLLRGDVSIISLHATKVFHTVEGGALILKTRELKERARVLINNGLDSSGNPVGLGINGRMSELHAAVGLSLLNDLDTRQRKRWRQFFNLRSRLEGNQRVTSQKITKQTTEGNWWYLALTLPNARIRDDALEALTMAGYLAKPYFHPSLNRWPMYNEQQRMSNAEKISSTIICLTMTDSLSDKDLDGIVSCLETCVSRISPYSLRRWCAASASETSR